MFWTWSTWYMRRRYMGATVDEKTQVSVILESLTPAFLPFTTNYIMNKLEYNSFNCWMSCKPLRPSVKRGPRRVRQMLPKEGHLLLLVGPTRTRRRRRLVGLEHSPIRDHPSAVGRKTTPRIRILRESVSTVELKVTGRETWEVSLWAEEHKAR